ncbi:hypothetical protein ACIP98_13320 [Streptomyces sp. NPDC088354]|uniref:hypothetical protein n=1 Tax=unclassified Streptomyces TaxID=2593676 RepID=UPI0029B8B215|nr:hypothetical protein [Streptomyces sp. MI02-7b]MDX3071168.1 hypothetical protein [Streptomyces sp. MI02-7b]
MLNTHTRTRGRTRTGSLSGRRRALLGAPVAVLLVLALQGCQDAATDAGDKPSAPAASTPAGGGAAPGTSQPDDGQASTPSPSTPAASDDPCSLVTQLEADQLAGMPLGHGRAIGDTCTYTAPPDGPTGQVEVYTGESGKNYYDAEHQIHGDALKPLKDVGDEAYLADGEVFLRVGEQWVSIRLVRLEDGQEQAQPLTDLARKVADRL